MRRLNNTIIMLKRLFVCETLHRNIKSKNKHLKIRSLYEKKKKTETNSTYVSILRFMNYERSTTFNR